MMNTFAKLFVAALFGLAALVTSPTEAFFHKKKAPQATDQDYFKKLGIERPETPIRAPDFILEDLSGKKLSLKSLKGKVVFLNFWATWCVPCRQEMPTMEKLHREYKKAGLEVVAVNFRESKEVARKFVAELGLTFTILLDTNGKVSEEYGVWSLPLSYFINRKGEFVGKLVGYRKWDGPEANALFRDLLAEKP
ncbi:MAG: TlpA family protein disulfide reductase [Deltaproteobacteria bacterium]|nr:TlpA family protein disulfide reductase [Deltaproteobacteria bacterium]